MESQTGPSVLDDVGILAYNGILFNSLYSSSVHGTAVKDAANRTVKYMEYEIVVDGYVTLPDGQATTDNTWANIRKKLDQQGGALQYTSKGFGPLSVNAGTLRDLKWGPTPEVLDFIPMGGARSAQIKWRVKTCVPEGAVILHLAGLAAGQAPRAENIVVPIVQFNYDIVTEYDGDGFSHIDLSGTLEIGMTRETQPDRNVPATADSFRAFTIGRVLSGMDLSRFKVTKRLWNYSRDKRTMTWSVSYEELPYMTPPEGMQTANGNFSVRPADQVRHISGSIRWVCTAKASYIVPNGTPRGEALRSFLALVAWRMWWSRVGRSFPFSEPVLNVGEGILAGFVNGERGRGVFGTVGRIIEQAVEVQRSRAWPFDFRLDEGLYLDSKKITFETSWTLITIVEALIGAAGVWRTVNNKQQWAASIGTISRSYSWLTDSLDPAADVIIDIGADPVTSFNRPGPLRPE